MTAARRPRMTASARALMWARMLVGLAFMQQGLMHVKELVLDHNMAQRALIEANQSWTAWPVVGGLHPMELALWSGGLEFTLGMFVFGGLLTRVSGLLLSLLALLWLTVVGLSDLAMVAFRAVLLAGALLVTVKGGGAHTMDSELGRMQQRTLEREAEREAWLRAQRSGGAAQEHP